MASGIKQYLIDLEDKPFCWKTNNCMSFVSGALEAQGLGGLPTTWCAGYETAIEAAKRYLSLLKQEGHETIIDAFDAHFDRDLTLHPKDGTIVSRKSDDITGRAFGITFGGICFFLTEEGAKGFEVGSTDIFWRVR